MKTLLVAATKDEVLPLISCLDELNVQCDIFVAGVGMVATAFSLGKKLALSSYDLAINAGIAGAFDRGLHLGDVVLVKEDHLSELGAEDNDDFLPIDALGFGESTFYPTFTFSGSARFPAVSAITVNKVHGKAASIEKTRQRLNPQIESMEGAAFFYACKQSALPAIQLRSISNYVEPRNRESWNIPLAIKRLNRALINLLPELKQVYGSL